MRRSLRQLSSDGAELGGYGLRRGHMALRLALAESLAEYGGPGPAPTTSC